MSPRPARFYQDVSVVPVPPSENGPAGYLVHLDSKPIKTPGGAPLMLPLSALAEAIADEWNTQKKYIEPQTLRFTRLANTAIDRVPSNRAEIIETILAFGKSDLLCYRAESPLDLAERQAKAWDSLLEWLKTRHGIALVTVSGMRFVPQPTEALLALERFMAAHDDFALVGLQNVAALTGSIVIALALAGGEIDAVKAFEAAYLDELFQVERWGTDQEAEAKLHIKRDELMVAARYLCMVGLK